MYFTHKVCYNQYKEALFMETIKYNKKQETVVDYFMESPQTEQLRIVIQWGKDAVMSFNENELDIDEVIQFKRTHPDWKTRN